MAKTRIRNDRCHVGNHDQNHISSTKDHRTSLDQGQISGLDPVDHKFRQSGVGEDRLTNDHSTTPPKLHTYTHGSQSYK